mgnify:CR=1 FL=1
MICSEYSTVGKNISKYYTKSAGDFTDEADIKSIINVHNEILTKKKTNTTSKAKFSSVWGSMLYNTLREYASDEIITVAYKLNSGRTVTRYYSKNLLEMLRHLVMSRLIIPMIHMMLITVIVHLDLHKFTLPPNLCFHQSRIL